MAELPLAAIVEAVLFSAGQPLSVSALAKATGAKPDAVRSALAELKNSLTHRGINLAEQNGTYQLVTSPVAAAAVAASKGQTPARDLSGAALETLGLLAYRGPLTKHQLDAYRGVLSESILRALQSRELVCEYDRSSEPGKPIRYHVTHEFLAIFGLTSLSDLPSLPDNQEVSHAR